MRLQDAGASAGRVLPLDGLRGIAILLVLVYHGLALSNSGANTGLDDAVVRTTMFGWTGVDLFFVLSGFLITGILLDNRGKSGSFVTFYGRRFLRIVPVYFVFLAALMFVLPLVGLLRDNADIELLRSNQAWYWTFTFNVKVALEPLAPLGRFGNAHLWSLMVEEQFYLIWPFIVLLLPRRTLLPVFLICVVVAPLFRYGIVEGTFPRIYNGFSPRLLMPARMDTLAIGAVVAYALRDASTWNVLIRTRVWILGASVVIVATLTMLYGRFWMGDRQTLLVGLTAIAVLYGCVVSIVATTPASSRTGSMLTHRSLRMFGRYSYALYVVHFQVMVEVSRQWGDRLILGSHLPSRLLFAAVTIALSTVIAWLSWHLLEQPILSLRRYLPPSTPVGASTVQEPAGFP